MRRVDRLHEGPTVPASTGKIVFEAAIAMFRGARRHRGRRSAGIHGDEPARRSGHGLDLDHSRQRAQKCLRLARRQSLDSSTALFRPPRNSAFRPKEVVVPRSIVIALVLAPSVLGACATSHFYPFSHRACSPNDPVRQMNGQSCPMP
jgi:hypothetical protein